MKTRPYIFLSLLAFTSIVFTPLMIPSGGTTWDGAQYIHLAYNLPAVEWDLWPLGFPVLIRIFKFLSADYYWAARLCAVFCYAAIAVFSFYKKFYFKETVVLLCTKIFFFSLFFQTSEGPFITLMYFLFYYLHEYFAGRLRGRAFFIPCGILLGALFLVRYSGVYLYVAMGLFYIYDSFRFRFRTFFRNDFFYALVVGGILIGAYCIFNYLMFGDFAGEKFRRASSLRLLSEDTVMQVLSGFNMFNPILGVKAQSLTVWTLLIEAGLLAINAFFIYFYIKLMKQIRGHQDTAFYYLLTFMGMLYYILMFATSYVQFLELLNLRMLSEASMCFFTVMVLLSYKFRLWEKPIFMLAAVSVLFNTLYALKVPGNFLKTKREVEAVMPYYQDKKYFFDDLKEHEGEVAYRIPILNKEVKYRHDNLQPGAVRLNIITSKNPEIRYLFFDTLRDRSAIIYNSELKSRLENFHGRKLK